MDVICIDPGLYSMGVYYRWGDNATWKKITNKKKHSTGYCLNNILTELNKIAEQNHFDMCFLEGYAFNPKNKRSGTVLPEVVGVVKTWLYIHDIPFLVVPVQTWKSLTIGHIDKSDSIKYLRAVEAKYKILFDNTDVADAYMMYQAVNILAKKTKFLSAPQIKLKRKLEEIINLAKSKLPL